MMQSNIYHKIYSLIQLQRDLEIRQLKEANAHVMQRLIEMSIRYQEMAPLITRYTIEYDVKLPDKRTLSTSSNLTESTRSTPTCSKEKDLPDVKSSKSDSSSRGSSIAKIELTFQV
jgi:hypothetical protein